MQTEQEGAAAPSITFRIAAYQCLPIRTRLHGFAQLLITNIAVLTISALVAVILSTTRAIVRTGIADIAVPAKFATVIVVFRTTITVVRAASH